MMKKVNLSIVLCSVSASLIVATILLPLFYGKYGLICLGIIPSIIFVKSLTVFMVEILKIKKGDRDDRRYFDFKKWRCKDWVYTV